MVLSIVDGSKRISKTSNISYLGIPCNGVDRKSVIYLSKKAR